MFDGIIESYFNGLGVKLCKSFTRYASAAISSCSFSTHEISRHLSKETGKDFNTSEKGLNYLLSNDNFQIDDHYWRMHINLIFNLLKEQELISEKKKVHIQVDFTSNKDQYLILCASIISNNRAVPLYFTMRNYPKRKNMLDQKKMELAFLKGLKHCLSKKYQYVIVADRGFGTSRFIQNCEEIGFEYLIRIKSNMNIEIDEKAGKIDSMLDENAIYDAKVPCWNKNCKIFRCSNDKGEWYLVSNINDLSLIEAESTYKNRFKIEKCFQDMKSSGFNIEKTKIRKYNRYKRLLSICMLAHALLVLLGHFIAVKLPSLLKNSALMASVTLAYFQLENKHISYFQSKHL